jgi:hypothetical protein
MDTEKQEVLYKIEEYKKAIETLKKSNEIGNSVFKLFYTQIIKSEWELRNIENTNLKRIVKEVFEENPNDVHEGKYQYKISLTKDMQGNLHVETSIDETAFPSEWVEKKDFALDKFNSIGIPFEKVKEGRFDIWNLNGYDFNVHFTHIENWYGISLNAINNGYDFILIDSNFTFCIFSNSFVKKLYSDGLLSPTKGEKSNHFQQNLYIDWLNEKVYDYNIRNNIGVVGIEEYRCLFEKYL